METSIGNEDVDTSLDWGRTLQKNRQTCRRHGDVRHTHKLHDTTKPARHAHWWTRGLEAQDRPARAAQGQGGCRTGAVYVLMHEGRCEAFSVYFAPLWFLRHTLCSQQMELG